MIQAVSEPAWQQASELGVHDRTVERAGSNLLLHGGQSSVINMSSYSYLGLDEDSRIMSAAEDGLRSAGVLNSSLSRIRMRLQLLDDAEESLSELFNADVGTVASCSAAAWSVLPILASGLLTGGVPPLMAFDAHAHFCLQALKAACADETEVVTIRHNDIERLEALCREHDSVAYVADSVYSTGGTVAPMSELLRLQSQYGLYLLLDEAHGTSVAGKSGGGYALDAMGEINDRTFIVTSLNKGFGASGGAILFGPKDSRAVRTVISRHGGPFLWSQRINAAGLGAILGSVKIHSGPELASLQSSLRSNIAVMDAYCPSALGSGSVLPVRLFRVGRESEAVALAARVLERGYYVEPDFFPVVPKGEAGIRVRLRANMSENEIVGFASALAASLQ
ncbi:aminotransferase class I and II [Rathayibacter rathayi]|nr:aminotransferase class I and II [Rathayibacter rathayi]PPG98745.1 aminotransferase class I and II [Rathayibacter rathayi]